jgi:membrane protein YdbS with pleckstrin-like domain
MLAEVKKIVVRLARVPPEPHPPAGSIRVFRAAENYWKLVLVRWGLKQAVGAFFLVLFASMTTAWSEALIASPLVRRENAPATAPSPSPTPAPSPSPATETAEASPPAKESRAKRQRRRRSRPPLEERYVRWVARGITAIELIGALTFLVQLPFSLAAARLDYEMRWYIVTDRSLRIREGIMRVREMTLTFANVQNITVRQGPLQRLLGIADVVVRTAGGGGSSEGHGESSGTAGASMHVGKLRAVDNAVEVRDLILERLRRWRDSGLGDPDDRHHHHDAEAPVPATTLEAATALRDAARALAEALRS